VEINACGKRTGILTFYLLPGELSSGHRVSTLSVVNAQRAWWSRRCIVQGLRWGLRTKAKPETMSQAFGGTTVTTVSEFKIRIQRAGRLS
jgi:hypothetical protein